MFKRIKVSAPGKLMLLGEHAVVYGYPCLVTAVDKRVKVEAEIIGGKKNIIVSPQVKESKFVEESVKLFKEKYSITKPVKITTNGDFSHRVGLGSSSAVTVATIKVLSKIFKLSISLKEIFNLSYKVTLSIQGVGSGFDIAAAAFGKTLYFIKSGKKIKVINSNKLPLVVGYSGVKADTPLIVKKLKSKIKNPKSKTEIFKIFASINNIVEQGRKALVEKNWFILGELMTKNHKLLQRLGVSTPKLDMMVKVAITAGAWGAKLSGAGGGDCMIALVSEQKRLKVKKAIEKADGEIINIKTNAAGVKIE